MAQPCLSQELAPSNLVTIGSGDAHWLSEYKRWFQDDKPLLWPDGWRRARAMGWVLNPVLQSMLFDSNGTRRRLALTAAGLAGGFESYVFIKDHLAKRRTQLADSVVGLVVMALGEGRHPDDLVLRDISQHGEMVWKIAAGLAMRRFGNPAPPPRWYADADPGVVAVAFGCRVQGHTQKLAGWLSERPERPHAELVRRGYMLGDDDGPSTPEEMSVAVEALLDSGNERGATRRAAALYLSRVQTLAGLKGRMPPRPELVPILASNPAMRRQLIAKGLLVAVPPRRLEQEVDTMIRARNAVAYALGADLGIIRDTAKAWSGDLGVAPALCIALAWRLLRRPEEARSQAARDLLLVLPDVPEAEWVRMATDGGEVNQRYKGKDPYLGKAFAYAAMGRLPDAQKIEVLEVALWRRGWHLGLFERDAQQDFVYDLLLAGVVSDQEGRVAKAYFADGIDRQHLCFRELRAFLQFLRAPGPRVPAAFRLRL